MSNILPIIIGGAIGLAVILIIVAVVLLNRKPKQFPPRRVSTSLDEPTKMLEGGISPFNLGALVETRFYPSDPILCGRPNLSLDARAYAQGTVKWVDAEMEMLGVLWDRVFLEVKDPKGNVSNCLTERKNNDADKNKKMFGDEMHNPSVSAGLQSTFTFADAMVQLTNYTTLPGALSNMQLVSTIGTPG